MSPFGDSAIHVTRSGSASSSRCLRGANAVAKYAFKSLGSFCAANAAAKSSAPTRASTAESPVVARRINGAVMSARKIRGQLLRSAPGSVDSGHSRARMVSASERFTASRPRLHRRSDGSPTTQIKKVAMRVWPGQPYPLGATWDGEGVNFALFSESATSVELCLFNHQADAVEAHKI